LPGCGGALLRGWASAADAGPFSSLAAIDRIAFDCHEPFTALAGAAAVTDRITLATTVAIAPVRSTALLAKQAATIDVISGGRLVLGLGIGARLDDYEVAGVEHRRRGLRFSGQLAELRSIWEGGTVGPRPVQEGGPRILVGGTSSGLAYARMARHADGFIHGGGPPRAFAAAATSALAAWTDAGRKGRPLLWGQAYFALGEIETGERYLAHYYAFTGGFVRNIVAGLLTTPQAIVQLCRAYEDAGCDEIVLLPSVADASQLERLSDAVAVLASA
jgi:alkanesulfonate monooxygenase SsuD/methylene tetrahydromethanopterin reductase-like flavin-dependent oxidoreductase (luciferase family)